MARDDLIETLRAAFAGDLAEGLQVLEGGLVALEGAEEPERRATLLREVFRAAHGLKGSARAAGFAAVEATCHLMESLLGAARDRGRALVHDDFAALLAAVDALRHTQERLGQEPTAEPDADEVALAQAQEGLRARVEGEKGAATPPAKSEAGHPEHSDAAPAAERSRGTATPTPTASPTATPTPSPSPSPTPTPTPTATPTPTPTATPTPTPTPTATPIATPTPTSPPTSASEAVRVGAAGEDLRADAQTGERSTPPPTPTPEAASPTIAAAPDLRGAPSTGARGRGGADPPRARLRLAPERLDALAVAGGALLAAVHQSEAKAERVDALLQELRRARASVATARPLLARAAVPTPQARGARDARAASAALAAVDDIHRVERGLAALRGQIALEGKALERRTRRLAAEVRALRLTPWTEATASLDRTARDVAAALGKEVEVEVEGEGLELDRSIVDALREPLAQLVRNAVDHGIEPPDARRAAGKAPRGRVAVAAAVEGERVRVSVSDDGRGLDPERLREEARKRGIAAPADARRALGLVFLPGFSTAGAVTEVSGRGVGLDVVASAVRQVRGDVTVSSTLGQGTTFELALPATLYGLRAVLAQDAGETFAIPALDVERIVRLSPERIATSDGRSVLLGLEPAPLAPLAHALGLATGPWSLEERRLALLVEAGGLRAAFAVDAVLAERELSLEPLGPRLESISLATAVASLPGGGLAVVLATRELVERAHGGGAPAVSPGRAAAAAPRRRVLLADDAATTRALAQSILEGSGYEVVAAADGEQAWTLLQQGGVDLVVSDVEMPRMDGFELTRAIRQSPRHARLPVVLLTALESDGDRRRGLEAGADAYLVKAAFDQRVLVDTIAELLEDLP